MIPTIVVSSWTNGETIAEDAPLRSNAMEDRRPSALLVVDVQKDFCPGGALPVPDGDQVVQVLNQYIVDASARGWPVYASRDWHPPVTRHFQPYGGQWPPHCVQNTEGANFHPHLRLPAFTIVISKGQDPDTPGYSALQGHTPDGTLFLEDLRERRMEHLYVGGLATDYCVKHSVLDLLRAGLAVTVLGDAIAGVDVQPGDSARALADMRKAGADVVGS
jgi:nicotinamidase/pyrazinamidase